MPTYSTATMIAPMPGQQFSSCPSGATYIADSNGGIFGVLPADVLELLEGGCTFPSGPFKVVVPASGSAYTLSYPAFGDVWYDITLSDNCVFTMGPGSPDAPAQTMRILIRPNGFQATLPSSGGVLVSSGSAPTVPSTSAITEYAYASSSFSAITPSKFQFQIGINLSGLEDGGNVPGTAGTDYAVPTTAEMDYFKSLGMTHVRLPGKWERIQPTLFGALSTTYLRYFQSLVSYAASIGLLVLIDPLHNFGGRYDSYTLAQPVAVGDRQVVLTATPLGYAAGASVGIPNGASIGTIAAFSAGATTIPLAAPALVAVASGALVSFGGQVGNTISSAAFADVWTKLATVFRGNAGILGYDIMNEPANMPPSLITAGQTSWPDAAQAAVTAIRAVDTTTMIFVEGDGYSGAGAWLVNNANLNIVDPSNNLAYAPHSYLDRDSSGTYPNWGIEDATPLQSPPNIGAVHTTQVGVQRVTIPITWGRQNGHQIWTGETGIGTDGNVSDQNSWEVGLYNQLSYQQSLNVPAILWAGGPYTGNYFLGLEPSGTVGNYVDRRAIAVVRSLTGVGWNAGVALFTGSNRGSPATAMTLSLEVRGYFTQPQTFHITSDDPLASFQYNGQTLTGGSFTVQPTTGFNLYAAVTHIPGPNAISSTLTITTPSNIKAPAALGFSTIADPLANEPAQAVNVLLPLLINTSYIGPIAQIYGMNAVLPDPGISFYPDSRVVGGTFTQADVAAKIAGVTTSITLGGVTTSVTGWRIRLLAQEGLGNDQTLVPAGDDKDGPGGSTSLAPSLADLPVLYFNAAGKPCIYYNQSRLVANSPISGATQQWTMIVSQPTTVASMQFMAGNNFTAQDVITGDSAGDWTINDGSGHIENVSMGILTDTLRVYTTQFNAGVRTTFRDGAQVASITSEFTSITYPYRSLALFGHFSFYPSYSQGLLNAYITFVNAIPQAATQAALLSAIQAFYTTPQPVGQVTGVTASAVTPGTSTLSWTPVAGASSYNVERATHGATDWTAVATNVTSATTPLTVMDGNATYDYRVTAVSSSAGVGIPSATLSVTYPAATVGTGPTLSIIGVNVAGLENYPAPIIPDSTLFAYFKSKGFTHVRIPFNQQSLMPTLLGPITSSPYITSYYGSGFNYVSQLQATAQAATSAGLKAALDCHNYAGFYSRVITSAAVASDSTVIPINAGASAFLAGASVNIQSGTSPFASNTTLASTPTSDTSITLSAATTSAMAAGTVIVIKDNLTYNVTDAAFADMWGKIAALPWVSSNPNIIFDLQNEPQVVATKWATTENLAIAAIRSAETTAGVAAHQIWADAVGYNAGSAHGGGVNYLNALSDSGNNLVVEFHQYADSDGSGSHSQDVSATIEVDRIQAFVGDLTTAGKKGMLGEFADGVDAISLADLANTLAYLQTNGQPNGPILGFSWWGGGDFGPENAGGYYYGIDPNNGSDQPWIPYIRGYVPGGINYGQTRSYST